MHTLIYIHTNTHTYIYIYIHHMKAYMQFLAARSLCTNFLSDKYSIPLAMSRHMLIKVVTVKPYKRHRMVVCYYVS